jgi:hypothetical protein
MPVPTKAYAVDSAAAKTFDLIPPDNELIDAALRGLLT